MQQQHGTGIQTTSFDDRSSKQQGSRIKALMHRACQQEDVKLSARRASEQNINVNATLSRQINIIASLRNDNASLQQQLAAALKENSLLRKIVEEQQKAAVERNHPFQYTTETVEAHQREHGVIAARDTIPLWLKPMRTASTQSYEAILAARDRLPMHSDAVQRRLSTNAQEQLRVKLEIYLLQRELQALNRKVGSP